jgi:tetratricopeptide (TPR) repeat protein
MDKNQLGIQMMQEGKWEEAAKAFMEAIEADPLDAVAYINFGNVLSAVGDPEKALKFFQKAIDLGGGGCAYYSAGALLFEKEQFNEAKNMFEHAMRDGLQTSDNYFMLGMCLFNLEQPKLALAYLQRSVELNGEDSEALFQFGLCLAQLEMLDEAMVQFEKCLENEPDHADAYYNLGVAYGYKENRDKAIEMFDKALSIQADHTLAAYARKLMDVAN